MNKNTTSLAVLAGMSALGSTAFAQAPTSGTNTTFDMNRLYQEVKEVVGRYHPKAASHQLGSQIQFKYDTRVFLIHQKLASGEWSNPQRMRGPNGHGIWGNIELHEGRQRLEKPDADASGVEIKPAELAKADLQSFNNPYFRRLLGTFYSKQLDATLLLDLRYTAEMPASFHRDLHQLLQRFEEHVSREAG